MQIHLTINVLLLSPILVFPLLILNQLFPVGAGDELGLVCELVVLQLALLDDLLLVHPVLLLLTHLSCVQQTTHIPRFLREALKR